LVEAVPQGVLFFFFWVTLNEPIGKKIPYKKKK